MKICVNCGIKNSDSRTKCEECGGNLRQLEEWEVSEGKENKSVIKRIVIVAIIILTLVGIGVFWYVKNYVIELGGADSPEALVKEYMAAEESLDIDKCMTYLPPYNRHVEEVIMLHTKGYSPVFLGVEITDYTEEELEKIQRSDGDVEKACHIAINYQVNESPYHEAGVETISLTAIMYKDRWFIKRYKTLY